jgi:hypothetical protein
VRSCVFAAPRFFPRGGMFMKRLLMVLTVVVLVTSFAVDVEAGLFGRRRSQCCDPCCQPTCCEPAPCCAPAPCPCEAAPAPCGCEATACCEPQPCCNQLSRREARRARRNGCCVETCSYQAPCGCEAAPACGCEASAPCGCGASAPCGCGATPIESAPMMEGGAPEAAPEAPAPAA